MDDPRLCISCQRDPNDFRNIQELSETTMNFKLFLKYSLNLGPIRGFRIFFLTAQFES